MAQTGGLADQARALLDGKASCAALAKMAKQLYIAGEEELYREVARAALKTGRLEAAALLAAAQPDVGQSKDLARQLKGLNDHGTARKLLLKAREQAPSDVGAAQQLALCTYKDEDLPPSVRYPDALKILDGEPVRLRDPSCDDPETLGLGGAVYKRLWQENGRIEDLETALHFYRKGWESNPDRDMGYCGVNAAYILDVLARRDRAAEYRKLGRAGAPPPREAEARKLRQDMHARLSGFEKEHGGKYWYLVTMAEIAFGLADWAEARRYLGQARQVGHDEWERQTTVKQLVSIARMRGEQPPGDEDPAQWSGPWLALHAILGDTAYAAFESHRGKVGLALSGGGFRASLYHLGVLARFTECDVLRSVEVLSTVSGGSIVGAHYYLELRRMLRENTDGELRVAGRDAYVQLVRRVTEQFCAGVQTNLRVSAFSNFFCNLKMLLSPLVAYGRSNRMGELYEARLFSRIQDGMQRPRRMHDLLIKPKTGAQTYEEDFKPKYSNWRRRAKVPTLLLNATSLNSGHNWQFTASWMGEPPGLMGQEVDMNERYRRLYYHQAPRASLRDYPLGYAVAASAGVPALFDPLALKGLYPGRTLQLVDGGVHDNQGVAGLLDESCNLILCSDASGQMDDQDSPGRSELSVFFRSDSILQDRLREAQYQDLAWRVQNGALHGLFFIHLKQELQTDPIDWIRCEDPSQPTSRPSSTTYGVDRTLQRHLSAIRTDLDTFSEVESLALMASGYLMATRQLEELDKLHKASGFPGTWGDFDIGAPCLRGWPFEPLLRIVAADPAGSDRRARDLARQLEVSQKLFGKVWFLVGWLRWSAILLGFAAFGTVSCWIWHNWDEAYSFCVRMNVGGVVLLVAGVAAAFVLPFGRHIQMLADFRKWLLTLFMALAGSVASWVHLLLFEPLFKRRGSLKRLLNLKPD